MKCNYNKQDRIIELLDNYFFGLKMIHRGEATEEELEPQFKQIEKELNRYHYRGSVLCI
jgi:hypothetical protein